MTMAKQWSAVIQTIGDEIAGLSLIQAVELSEYLEKVHGLKPAENVVQIPQDSAPKVVAPPPQTEFKVILEGCDPAKRIVVIKVVREITSLSLKEAKDFVEALPKVIRENLPRPDAEALKSKLEAAGGKASLQ